LIYTADVFGNFGGWGALGVVQSFNLRSRVRGVVLCVCALVVLWVFFWRVGVWFVVGMRWFFFCVCGVVVIGLFL